MPVFTWVLTYTCNLSYLRQCSKSEVGFGEGRETDCFVKAASAMCPTVKYCAWGPVL